MEDQGEHGVCASYFERPLWTTLPAIATIYADHVRAGTATFELDRSGRRRDAAADGTTSSLAACPIWSPCATSQIVGYAYAGPYRPRPAYRFTVEDSIYVRADCAGQGIGRALLDALIVACERADARQMIAVIGDSANASSIRLHAAAGFAHAGLLSTVGLEVRSLARRRADAARARSGRFPAGSVGEGS